MDAIWTPAQPRDALAYGGDGRGFCNVPALRTDGQGPPSGPQGEPLEHQDQAALPAEPGQRHLHLGRPRPQRAPARLDQCAEERRPQWRPRRVFDQGQGRRALPPRAGSQARDREEGWQAGIRQEGELSFSYIGGSEFEAAGSKDPAVLFWTHDKLSIVFFPVLALLL